MTSIQADKRGIPPDREVCVMLTPLKVTPQ
jgi:hypothetical protein